MNNMTDAADLQWQEPSPATLALCPEVVGDFEQVDCCSMHQSLQQ